MPPSDAAAPGAGDAGALADRARLALLPLAPELDRTVAAACGRLHDTQRWSAYELCSAGGDLFNLNGGHDCCYDRPSIGLAYALWYHGRRVQDMARALLPALCEQESNLTIVDLGCGTGATAWAVALVERARRRAGGRTRAVHVSGVDASPFMCAAACSLWQELAPGLSGEVKAEFQVANWADVLDRSDGRLWLTAGFLFDASDQHLDGLADTFARVVARSEADRVFVLGSHGKDRVMRRAAAAVRSTGYDWEGAVLAGSLWQGTMEATSAVRQEVFGRARASPVLRRACEWADEHDPILRVLRVGSAQWSLFDLGGGRHRLPALDEVQRAAAEPDGRLTYVHGAAGSGKSRVLIERVARTLEKELPRHPTSVLVTAFNQAMVRQLGDWLVERIEASPSLGLDTRPPGDGADWELVVRAGGHEGCVRLLNWDKAPPRLFDVPGQDGLRDWDQKIQERVSHCLASLPPSHQAQRLRSRLTVPFLKAELDRVIYGLGASERDSYLADPRTGRQKQLRTADRAVVWNILMGAGAPPSFTGQRIAAHRRLTRSGRMTKRPPFSHVFVDEAQDFTQADFDLIAALVERPHHIVACCDEAQALHLGTSYRRPSVKGANWKVRRLRGSYRLPIRVCEAVRPLAERIAARRRSVAGAGDVEDVGEDFVLPESVKSAVLGPRPIIVAGSEDEVAGALRSVLSSFAPLLRAAVSGDVVVCVAERDEWVMDRLANAPPGMTVRRESMRAIKGLERPCVVLSTRVELPHDESLDEWIYTVLTRTTALLVLALSERTSPELREVIAQLRPDRLMAWNDKAGRLFRQWRPQHHARR